MLKLIAVLTVSTITLGFGGGASGCHAKRNIATAPTETQMKANFSEPKTLAESFHSSITHPFVAVVRDTETYAALVKLDGNLPQLDEEFFKTNIAVAAFLGERNTGGYRLEITREASGDIRIAEKVPGKGVMVPQMITSPFTIVSVPVGEAPLLLSLDRAWRQNVQAYQVSSGTFTMSGGFAGTREQFGVKGELRILREGSLATFAFAFLSSGLSKHRSLIGFATGVVDGQGHITLHKLSADSFVNSPNGGLKANGQFTLGQNKLSLLFSPGPSMIADGYVGQGGLEAELVGSATKP